MPEYEPLNPPLEVRVRTDNLRTVHLVVSEASGREVKFEVSCDGNVYQGLHGIRTQLQEWLNDTLAAHGVPFVAPPAPPAAVDEIPPTAPEAA